MEQNLQNNLIKNNLLQEKIKNSNIITNSEKINDKKYQKIFEPDNQESSKMLYLGMSFYFCAADAIIQRTQDFMSIEIIAVTASINYYFCCEQFCKYILTKFKTNFDNNLNLLELFLLLPNRIQQKVEEHHHFDIALLSQLPKNDVFDFFCKNYKTTFSFYNLFISMARILKNFVIDIEQNNYFL